MSYLLTGGSLRINKETEQLRSINSFHLTSVTLSSDDNSVVPIGFMLSDGSVQFVFRVGRQLHNVSSMSNVQRISI